MRSIINTKYLLTVIITCIMFTGVELKSEETTTSNPREDEVINKRVVNKELKIGHNNQIRFQVSNNDSIKMKYPSGDKSSYFFKINKLTISNTTSKAQVLDLTVNNYSYMNIYKDVKHIINSGTTDLDKAFLIWNYLQDVVQRGGQSAKYYAKQPDLFLFSQGHALCGQMSVLLEKMFSSIGLSARVVSSQYASTHGMAEVKINNEWVFFDFYHRLFFPKQYSWEPISTQSVFQDPQNYLHIMNDGPAKAFLLEIFTHPKLYTVADTKAFNYDIAEFNNIFKLLPSESIEIINHDIKNPPTVLASPLRNQPDTFIEINLLTKSDSNLVRRSFFLITELQDGILTIKNDQTIHSNENKITGVMNRDVFERILPEKTILNRCEGNCVLNVVIDYDLIPANIKIWHDTDDANLNIHTQVANNFEKIVKQYFQIAKDKEFIHKLPTQDGAQGHSFSPFLKEKIAIPLYYFPSGSFFYKIILETESGYIFESRNKEFKFTANNNSSFPINFKSKPQTELNGINFPNSLKKYKFSNLIVNSYPPIELESGKFCKLEIKNSYYRCEATTKFDSGKYSIAGYFQPESFSYYTQVFLYTPSFGIGTINNRFFISYGLNRKGAYGVPFLSKQTLIENQWYYFEITSDTNGVKLKLNDSKETLSEFPIQTGISSNEFFIGRAPSLQRYHNWRGSVSHITVNGNILLP